MMLSYRADEHAALVFDDLASALDAGLPLESLGGDPALGDQVLIDLARRRGVTLRSTEEPPSAWPIASSISKSGTPERRPPSQTQSRRGPDRGDDPASDRAVRREASGP